jgi:hypothetical protein
LTTVHSARAKLVLTPTLTLTPNLNPNLQGSGGDTEEDEAQEDAAAEEEEARLNAAVPCTWQGAAVLWGAGIGRRCCTLTLDLQADYS